MYNRILIFNKIIWKLNNIRDQLNELLLHPSYQNMKHFKFISRTVFVKNNNINDGISRIMT